MSKELLKTLLGQRVVAYHPILAKVMGSASGGIWLSQILYWDKIKVGDWFYKSMRDLIGETGITEREGKTAKAISVKLGIVDCKVKGLPRVSHYHVNYDTLETLISESANLGTEASNKSDTVVQLDNTGVSNKLGQSLIQNDPQITTETTPEITNKVLRLSSNPFISEMQKHFGFPGKLQVDPIPNPGKEAKFIKKMLSRGFGWSEIFNCWEGKVQARHEFVSMAWVNEDIGKERNGSYKPGVGEDSTAKLKASVGAPLPDNTAKLKASVGKALT